MASHVICPDDELVLTGFLRARLAGTAWATALVSNRLTVRADGAEVAPAADFAVIVRGDGGHAGPLPTFTRRFGIRIFGPDGDLNHQKTMGLARHVAATIATVTMHTVEVAAVRAIHGPYRVPGAVPGRPEAYMTCELVFVGAEFTS